MLGALTLAVLALSPATGAAQCASGREVGPDTAGRCCWPGQRFDDERGRCEGPPSRCPSGWGAAGDECVQQAAPPSTSTGTSTASEPRYGDYAPQPAAGAQPWYGEAGTGSPSYGQPAPGWERPPESTRTEPIMGVMQTGLMFLAVGFGSSMGFAIATSQQYTYYSTPSSWPFGFVPLVGGFAWGISDASYCCGSKLGLALGIPASVVQLLGFVMAIAGGAARRPAAAPVRLHGDLDLPALGSPRVTGGPGEAGVGLEWSF